MYHLFFSCTADYVKYAAVCMASIVRNTDGEISYKEKLSQLYQDDSILDKEERYCFYILTDKYDERQKQKLSLLEQELTKIFPTSIEYHETDERDFLPFPMWRRSYSVYYSLKFLKYIPGTAKRVLKIDSDMLVCDDIRKVFTEDFGGNMLAGVANYPVINHTVTHKKGGQPFSYAHNKAYINGGLIFFDVQKWIAENGEQKVIDFLQTYNVQYAEQDALNGVFRESIKVLPFKWNVMHHNAVPADDIFPADSDKTPSCYYGKKEFFEGAEKPSLLHYSAKPWDSNGFRISFDYKPYFYPNFDLWWDMAEKTPVFAEELLAIKQSSKYLKAVAENRKKEKLLSYGWYRAWLTFKRDTRPFFRALEQPVKKLRTKIRVMKNK